MSPKIIYSVTFKHDNKGKSKKDSFQVHSEKSASAINIPADGCQKDHGMELGLTILTAISRNFIA